MTVTGDSGPDSPTGVKQVPLVASEGEPFLFSIKIITMRFLLVFAMTVLFYSGTLCQTSSSKSEIEQITSTIMNYIDGTANGEPDKLRLAFHPEFNLYTVEKDSLRVRSGEKYIANVKIGERSNRIGRIISIDFEKDAAIAKAEIVVPNWRIFTDYFLLVKYQGSWKIIQKSYTWREYPKG